MGGRLAFQRCVHRQHNLVDTAGSYARYESVDIQIFGSHAVQRRQPTTKHMIFSREQARAIKRPEVGHVFYYTYGPGIAACVGADATRISGIDIAANIACHQSRIDIGECF